MRVCGPGRGSVGRRAIQPSLASLAADAPVLVRGWDLYVLHRGPLVAVADGAGHDVADVDVLVLGAWVNAHVVQDARARETVFATSAAALCLLRLLVLVSLHLDEFHQLLDFPLV